MSSQIEIQLIAILVAVSASIPGVLLVLKNMPMIIEAISHTILLGIVLGFIVTKDLTSPFLILGASLVGLLTVFLIESLEKSKLVSTDAATGIIFPFLFSIGIILLARYGDNINLDINTVLVGEIAFTPFDRFNIFGRDLGPKSIYIMGSVLVVNLLFVSIFFKEIKISIFDYNLALSLGFSPIALHYIIVGLASLTAVTAFNSVGSILLMAFMVGPPITGLLLTNDFKSLFKISGLLGGLASIIGYQIARIFDLAIAGTISVVIGLMFILVLIFKGTSGILPTIIRRHRQRKDFIELSLLIHLYNHEKEGDSKKLLEADRERIHEYMAWDRKDTEKIINNLEKNKYIGFKGNIIYLTEEGRVKSKDTLKNLSG